MRPSFRGLVVALALAGDALAAGCESSPPIDRRVVVEWLTCIDCPPDQLNAVLSAAMSAPESVVAMLGADLSHGLDAAATARLDSASRSAFGRLQGMSAVPTPVHWRPTDQRAFLARQRLLATRTWRKRAAVALARIGTAGAKQALDDACPALADTLEIIAVASARLAVDTARGPCYLKADSTGVNWRPSVPAFYVNP